VGNLCADYRRIDSLIFGIELIAFKANEYDALSEFISLGGAEAMIILPDEGLISGCYYEPYEICSSTDWESGVCDETELHIKRVSEDEIL